MSGLRRTFSEGKRVARTRNCPVAKAVPSLERNSMEAGPAESFTETGIRPNDFPSAWRKSLMVRSFHFADETSAGHVSRSVPPKSVVFGEIEHCWAFVATALKRKTKAHASTTAPIRDSRLDGIRTIFSSQNSRRKQIREGV